MTVCVQFSDRSQDRTTKIHGAFLLSIASNCKKYLQFCASTARSSCSFNVAMAMQFIGYGVGARNAPQARRRRGTHKRTQYLVALTQKSTRHCVRMVGELARESNKKVAAAARPAAFGQQKSGAGRTPARSGQSRRMPDQSNSGPGSCLRRGAISLWPRAARIGKVAHSAACSACSVAYCAAVKGSNSLPSSSMPME